MRKTITFLTVLSLASAFFSGCSHNPTVEERLQSQYGWKGTLPKPAADSEAGKEPVQEPAVPPVIVSGEQQNAEQKPAPEKKDAKQETAPAKQETAPAKQETAPAKQETAPAEKKLTKADLSGEKREHVVQKGESLWFLALREYGNGIYWRWIYEENKDVIKDNPNHIAPGIKLRIPLLKKENAEPKKETPEKSEQANSGQTAEKASAK